MSDETKIEMFVCMALHQARMERETHEPGDTLRTLQEGRVKALEEVYKFLRAK